MPRKLYVYDGESWQDRMQAGGRFSASDPNLVTLRVSSKQDLIAQLDELVRRREKFERGLFQTHGRGGGIFVNNDYLSGQGLINDFKPRGYSGLFGMHARLYFDGCNVAQGDAGWEFLIDAGLTFLGNSGGIVFGWTSLGSAMPGWLPFYGGHTIHFYGDLRRVEFAPGGLMIGQPDASWVSRHSD